MHDNSQLTTPSYTDNKQDTLSAAEITYSYIVNQAHTFALQVMIVLPSWSIMTWFYLWMPCSTLSTITTGQEQVFTTGRKSTVPSKVHSLNPQLLKSRQSL